MLVDIDVLRVQFGKNNSENLSRFRDGFKTENKKTCSFLSCFSQILPQKHPQPA